MFRGWPVVGPARRSNSVAVLAPVFVFVKPNKNRLISRKPNSYLNHFKPLLFYTIPPPLDQYNLFWSYKKRAPKPLLGRRKWVTSTGGRHNLVPGLTTESRPPAWSAIWARLFPLRKIWKIQSTQNNLFCCYIVSLYCLVIVLASFHFLWSSFLILYL